MVATGSAPSPHGTPPGSTLPGAPGLEGQRTSPGPVTGYRRWFTSSAG